MRIECADLVNLQEVKVSALKSWDLIFCWIDEAARIYQGQQFIKDIENAPMREQFRGFPILENRGGIEAYLSETICPTGALTVKSLVMIFTSLSLV